MEADFFIAEAYIVMIQDRDCGDENDAKAQERRVELVCETCGGAVTIFYYPPCPEISLVMHDGCPQATVSLVTQNPQFLGMISG